MEVAELIKRLEEFYSNEGLTAELETERQSYVAFLPELCEKLSPYSNFVPIKLSQTSLVFRIFDHSLEKERILKITRPSVRLRNLKLIRGEGAKLSKLTHPSLVTIITAGDTETENGERYPFIVMEAVESSTHLDDFILNNATKFGAGMLLELFRQALAGISYLHSEGVIHCDLNANNMVVNESRELKILDLASAKYITKDHRGTVLWTTPEFAHPTLKDLIREYSKGGMPEVPRAKLSTSFDLFSLGYTFQSVLRKLKDQNKSFIFTKYQWAYLQMLTSRLLDGCDVQTPFQSHIPAIPKQYMQELKYTSAETALDDCEKIDNLYDLEGEVPELNANCPDYIQIPGIKVPLTPRVQRILEHPYVSQLNQVTQLGFVSVLYPGAVHTRFEHMLGTFAHSCLYVRALWNDTANCLFRNVMSREDIEIGLLACLLHDVGQYPMAHDLTEVADEFEHEPNTAEIIRKISPISGDSLEDIIVGYWGASSQTVDRIVEVLECTPGGHASIKSQILKSIISGPLDCDKLDYLKRDSIHLGVEYGLNIDEQRLLRNLTVIYGSSLDKVDDLGQRHEKLDFVTLGVAEKALAPARALSRARVDMFSQVYWHHTIRAQKAMLAYVVRRILISLKQAGTEEKDQFWTTFQSDFVMAETFRVRTSINPPVEGTSVNDPQEIEDDWLPNEEAMALPPFSILNPTDDLLLDFLQEFSDEVGREMIRNIRGRELFQRVGVVSSSSEEKRFGVTDDEGDQQIFDNFYNEYKNARVENNYVRVEDLRKQFEDVLLQKLSGDPLLSKRVQMYTPLLLIDVPIKGSAATQEPEKIRYLPEDKFGEHTADNLLAPQFSWIPVQLHQRQFDESVGKVRIFVPGAVRQEVVNHFQGASILSFLNANAEGVWRRKT